MRLGEHNKKATLAWEMIVPYCKRKLDQAHARAAEQRLYQPSLSGLTRLLLWLYPIAHAGYEGGTLLSHWLFMIGRSKHFHVSQRPLGQVFARASAQQAEPSASAPQTSVDTPQVAGEQHGRTRQGVVLLLLVACIKALDVWRRSDRRRAERAVDLPRGGGGSVGSGAAAGIPRLPPVASIASGGTPLPLDPAACPVCLGERVNPASSPSGVTYCYRCLATEASESGRCPVTHIKCAVEDIRRIFDDNG